MRPSVSLLVLAPGLIAAGAFAGELELTWSEPSPSGVRVERRAEREASFSQIAVVGPGTVRFVDSSLVTGERYCYRVQVVAGRPDTYSPEICAVAESAPILPAVSSPPPDVPSEETEQEGDPRVRPGRSRAEGGWLQVVPLASNQP